MQLNTSELEIVADIWEDGFIEVELIDTKGEVIAGYEFEKFSIEIGDNGRNLLCWRKQSLRLLFEEFNIHIRFKKAKLYSVSGDIDIHPSHPVF